MKKSQVMVLFSVALCAGAAYVVANKQKNHTLSAPHAGKKSQPKESMITTPSGMKYTIIKEAPANAAQPQKGDIATVHYTGWLDDKGQPGKKFDSSVDRKQAFQFIVGVGQVISGWDEAVLSMKVGEKRRIILPANLGYGARGAGSLIPPHATLIFDVELLGLNDRP